MIIKILHQIWNERKQNAWLFLELIVASLFLWLAIDPLFTLICRNNIPKGYEAKRLYSLKCDKYFSYEPQWREGMSDTKYEQEFLQQIGEAFDNIPEIESYFIGSENLQINNLSTNSLMYAADNDDIPDSLKQWEVERMYQIKVNEKSRFFETFRVRDAATGKILQQNDNAGNRYVYLSRKVAMKLFGTIDIVGKRITCGGNDKHNILGVFEDLQMLSYDEHVPLVLFCNDDRNIGSNYTEAISFRLKDGVDEDAFRKKFETEIAPKYTHANYYISGITPYEEIIEEHDKKYNITNKYRLYAALSGFALFCAFMGVFSAFWIRTNSRRRDIGIMRSVGASSGSVVGQFVTEAFILVTAAFIIALPFIMHYIYVEGFADPLAKIHTWIHDSEEPDQSYLHNRAVPHFAIVTAIAYICISAIAIVGALLPTIRITRSLPADVLRE